jgi:hypothetical protein
MTHEERRNGEGSKLNWRAMDQMDRVFNFTAAGENNAAAARIALAASPIRNVVSSGSRLARP